MPDRATAVWVLGDQLSREGNSALRRAPRGARVIMIESMALAQRLPFSRVRTALVWSAMRHFAKELRREGRVVDYHAVGDEASPRDEMTFVEILRGDVEQHGLKRLLVMAPAGWTLLDYVRRLAANLKIEVEITPNDLFLSMREPPAESEEVALPASPDALARTLRRRYAVLVDDQGRPEGGDWNVESESGKPDAREMPAPPATPADAITQEVIALVEDRFPKGVGILEAFRWPVSRDDALAWLEDFLAKRLSLWARHRDASLSERAMLAHSGLSAAMNLGLLSPLEVVAQVERAYRDGASPLAAAVGITRQIFGFREFAHQIHWARMPGHAEMNALNATRPLPVLFWTGETRCACLQSVLRRALDTGYASQTERLMILGNFLLLTGVEPRAAAEWFQAVFADGWEWAAIPNVVGLALWADGGLVAPKPYAASANYIDRISDHCGRCTYDHTARHGEDACPFNSLYWNFLDRNRERLGSVARMRGMIDSLAQRGRDDLAACAEVSERFLREIGIA